MDGIAARSAVRKARGCRSTRGHSSERKIAIPSATGAAMARASTDEYRVPQMQGSAPNWPGTGCQVLVVQQESPNFRTDSRGPSPRSEALAAAAAVTDSREAFRDLPALFFTAPYGMLFCKA